MVTIDLAKYPLSISSTVEPDWGIVQDFADDGVMHRRGLFGAQYFIVSANWGLLDITGRDALESLLLRYRMEQFTFEFDGHTYTGELYTPPARRHVSGHLYGITAQFRATRVDTVDPVGAIIAAYTQASVWYDPSDLSTMWQDTAGTIPAVPGLPVARIDDKGNLGLHATQATAANRPTLQRDSGGNYYLQFDGVDDALTIPTGMPVPTTGCCAVVAWQHDGYPATNPILYYQRATTADASHQHPLIRLANTGAVQALIGNQSSASVDGSTPAASPYAVTAHLATDNAARKSYLNGVLYGTATAPALTDAADSPTGAIGGATFAGRIYGVVHIQHGIADADRQTLERELMRRAGVI